MFLSAGARVGAFEIVALIGAGGMGEVYRARDTRLNRQVALKILPDEFAANPDRLMRFEREAQALASLNHSNIAHIHGFEDRALVMEFVDGDDLSARLLNGALPIDEALAIARQLVDALEAAHEQGVVHRDLKPANIKVRADGTVKVLDFGLAKAIEGTTAAELMTRIPSAAATQTSPALTKLGVILGTAAYMAPEQARGKTVDKRADIWAFGCVLYEMLTGRPPFAGDTSTDVIAAAITTQPDWHALPPSVGPSLRRLLTRCLEKDARLRLRDIGDARWDLAEASQLGTTESATPAAASPSLVWLLGGAVILLSAALAGLWMWSGRRSETPERLSVTFPEKSPMQLGHSQPSLAYSPDGRTIVYTANGPEGAQLWIRDVNAFAPTPIPGTAGGQLAFFSPDGKWIGFMGGGTVKKLPISLGPPVELCKYGGVPMGATWTSKNEVVFATRATSTALWRVPVTGGEPRAISSTGVWYPDALPSGDAVVVTTNNPAANETVGDLAIAVVTLNDGKLTRLFDGGTYVRYSPTGHLVYLRNNAIMAAPFDAASLTVGEARAVVIDPVYMDPAIVGGNFAISSSGALAYAPGDAQDFKRAIVDVTSPTLAPIINERRAYHDPRVSPDGRHLAVIETAWRDRIWVIDIARQSFLRLTTGHYLTETGTTWSPDGTRIVFRAVLEDQSVHLFVAASDGSGAERDLVSGFGEVTPQSWTADGKSLIFATQSTANNSDLMLVDVDGPPNVRPLMRTPYSETQASVSPDGKWLAFVSNRSSRNEVYVAPYPALTPITQVSTQGGTTPRWGRESRRLIFRRGQDAMAVPISPGAAIPPMPVKLTSFPSVFSTDFVDVMPDGRLIGIAGSPVGTSRELRLVLNWFNELRQKVK